MPRFFFHFRDGTFVEDEVGEILPDVGAARQKARRIALELSQDSERMEAAIVVADGEKTLFEVAVVERPPPG